MQKDRNKMGTMPMPGLILNMSLPLMFSLLIRKRSIFIRIIINSTL